MLVVDSSASALRIDMHLEALDHRSPPTGPHEELWSEKTSDHRRVTREIWVETRPSGRPPRPPRTIRNNLPRSENYPPDPVWCDVDEDAVGVQCGTVSSPWTSSIFSKTTALYEEKFQSVWKDCTNCNGQDVSNRKKGGK